MACPIISGKLAGMGELPATCHAKRRAVRKSNCSSLVPFQLDRDRECLRKPASSPGGAPEGFALNTWNGIAEVRDPRVWGIRAAQGRLSSDKKSTNVLL
jgi:hypothetical protein